MSNPRSWSWLSLLCVLLTACATSSPTVRTVGEEGEPLESVASSWEEARADPSCVVPLCGETGSAIWRCRDVEEEEAPRVLLAQAVVEPPMVEPPMVEMEPMLRSPGGPNRWWGRPLAVPGGAEPVFEIPWHNWNAREQYAPKVLRPPCVHSWEPLEKHHIFPQAFAAWFKLKPIDIHAFTVRVPRSFHRWLHSGGPSGGQWNEAWRQFIADHTNARPDEIWRFAGELMVRFNVNGPLVRYYCD